ncbi:MAG: flippase-like domain-containing protein [Candidatus Aenigmarchaeota archaeon]|nr:flippase-like domain-containing protein [Candidatus Aenigmarchaeota archaeon]
MGLHQEVVSMKKISIIKITASTVILALLLYFIDVGKIVSTLAEADPLLILLALVITPVSMALRFIRWNSITNLSGIRISMKETARVYMIGFFFGTITPSKLGDLLKFRYLNRDHGVPNGMAFSLSVLDRIFDLIVIIAVGSAALSIVYGSSELLSVALVVITFGVLLYAVFSRRIFKRLSYFFLSNFSFMGRLLGMKGDIDKESIFESLYKPFQTLKRSPSRVVAQTAMSFVIWLTVGIQAFLIFLALGVSVEFFPAFAMLCFATLVSLLPFTISGLGTREASMVFLFALLGVAADKTISMSLLYFVIGQIIVAVAGGVVYAASRSASRNDS